MDDSSLILFLMAVCNLLMDVLVLESCVVLYSCPSLRSSLMRYKMASLMDVLGSLPLYTLDVDESIACKIFQFVLYIYVCVNGERREEKEWVHKE